MIGVLSGVGVPFAASAVAASGDVVEVRSEAASVCDFKQDVELNKLSVAAEAVDEIVSKDLASVAAAGPSVTVCVGPGWLTNTVETTVSAEAPDTVVVSVVVVVASDVCVTVRSSVVVVNCIPDDPPSTGTTE